MAITEINTTPVEDIITETAVTEMHTATIIEIIIDDEETTTEGTTIETRMVYITCNIQ